MHYGPRPVFDDPVPTCEIHLLDRILISNVRGPFSTIRAFAPAMKKTGDAVVP